MHSNCSGNLQGNCGMAFGRVCSSSFEGSPLSLLACFCFRPYIWLIRSENSKTGWSQGLRWMLPCVEVDSGIISFGKIERTSTVVSFFFFSFPENTCPIPSKAIHVIDWSQKLVDPRVCRNATVQECYHVLKLIKEYISDFGKHLSNSIQSAVNTLNYHQPRRKREVPLWMQQLLHLATISF